MVFFLSSSPHSVILPALSDVVFVVGAFKQTDNVIYVGCGHNIMEKNNRNIGMSEIRLEKGFKSFLVRNAGHHMAQKAELHR